MLKSFPRSTAIPYFLVLGLSVLSLNGCASLSPDWQLQKQSDGISYSTRQSQQQPSLPEFKASVRINASIPDVMALVTDFSRHPEWVYRCKELSIISLKGYTEAYLYQVNSLPVIKDRDIILHARTLSSDDGSQVRILLSAAPHFCDNNDDEDCAAIRESKYIRVTEAEGEFVLNKIDNATTEIIWQQFLTPGGAIPNWLFRAMLADVPMQSLRRLKELLEDTP